MTSHSLIKGSEVFCIKGYIDKDEAAVSVMGAAACCYRLSITAP